MKILDFHTHAFPDHLAERAIAQLTESAGVPAMLDGKISTLLRTMDERGITQSVVTSIATRPEQFGPILKWSHKIASDRLVPFPSVHPDDPAVVERVRIVRAEGFAGIKLHPYYQDFAIDEARMEPLYGEAERLGLVVLVHGGFDPAFARERIASADRTVRVMEKFPGLKFVAAHLGAWEDWEMVREQLLGRPVYLDTSMAVDMMPAEEAKYFLLNHPADYLVFGSDAPWTDPERPLRVLEDLEIPEELKRKILWENGRRLLGDGFEA